MGVASEYRAVKKGCYFLGFSMSAAANISALLFITFNELYGISFTALGFLVLVNFCSQLAVDLIFTFFSKKFNISLTVKAIPLIVVFGLLIYAVIPMLFPGFTYVALVAGTVVFSIGAGLGEVLTSPVVAAIPSDNPEGEMSKLHSAYAWGVVGVVIVSTVFIRLFGNEKWPFLALLWCVLPLVAWSFLFKSKIPVPEFHSEKAEKGKSSKGILLCTLCIFFGGAAECTMIQWVSGFAEKGLGISKLYGDIFGMALFALTLGLGRTLYSLKCKNIYRILLLGMCSSALCYIVAAFSSVALIGLAACVLTGFCTSMLWPGMIIYTNEKYVSCGVGVYALLAAGGDLGASLSPQLLGVLADRFDMNTGMLVAAAFPLCGFIVLLFTERYFKRKKS